MGTSLELHDGRLNRTNKIYLMSYLTVVPTPKMYELLITFSLVMLDYPMSGWVGGRFLAPTGAQGVTLSVCPSVRLSVRHKVLSRFLNLHLSC